MGGGLGGDQALPPPIGIQPAGRDGQGREGVANAPVARAVMVPSLQVLATQQSIGGRLSCLENQQQQQLPHQHVAAQPTGDAQLGCLMATMAGGARGGQQSPAPHDALQQVAISAEVKANEK